MQQLLVQPEAVSAKEFKSKAMSPESQVLTVYIADLPRTTSYLDLSEIFEKGVGPCSIQIKR